MNDRTVALATRVCGRMDAIERQLNTIAYHMRIVANVTPFKTMSRQTQQAVEDMRRNLRLMADDIGTITAIAMEATTTETDP